MSRRDGASRLLGWAVRLLPVRRQDWGRAMLAELAAIEAGPARWGFALSCTRATLVVPATLLAVALRVLAAGVIVTAVVLAAGVPAPAVRREALALVAILTGLAWLARRAASGRAARVVVGGGFAVLAGAALLFIADARQFAGDDVKALVWTAMLTIYAVALVRLTAAPDRTLAMGAGVAVAAAGAWLLAAAIAPEVPTTNGPALAAIGAAAVWAGLRSRIAGLAAGAGTALLIAVLIDGPLPLFSQWVPNSAPPVYPPDAPERLVDSVAVWLLGTLLAAAVAVAVRAARPRAALVRG